jgi:hypothetical protein
MMLCVLRAFVCEKATREEERKPQVASAAKKRRATPNARSFVRRSTGL